MNNDGTGFLREKNRLCVYTIQIKLTLCGERIDEFYYIFCFEILKCILEKVVVVSLFLFYCEMVLI